MRPILLTASLLAIGGCNEGKWEFRASTDPMTDKEFRYASVSASNGPWRFTIECTGDDAEPFAAFEGLSTLALTDKTITGQYRLDKARPQRINIGYYGGVLAFPRYEQKRFFSAARGRKRLAVEISNDYPVMIFNISGIDAAVSKACRR